jgi:hypothetical protein
VQLRRISVVLFLREGTDWGAYYDSVPSNALHILKTIETIGFWKMLYDLNTEHCIKRCVSEWQRFAVAENVGVVRVSRLAFLQIRKEYFGTYGKNLRPLVYQLHYTPSPTTYIQQGEILSFYAPQ